MSGITSQLRRARPQRQRLPPALWRLIELLSARREFDERILAAVHALEPLFDLLRSRPTRRTHPSREHLMLVYLSFVGGDVWAAAAAAAPNAAHIFDACHRQHALDLARWRRLQAARTATLANRVEAYVLRHPSDPLVRAALAARPVDAAERRAQERWRRYGAPSALRALRIEQLALFRPSDAPIERHAHAADSPIGALARQIHAGMAAQLGQEAPSERRQELVDLAVALVYGSSAARHVWFVNARTELTNDMIQLLVARTPNALRRAARVALRSITLRAEGQPTHTLPLDLWKNTGPCAPPIRARLALCSAIECLALRAPDAPIVAHLGELAGLAARAVDVPALARASPPTYPPADAPLAPEPPDGNPAARASAALTEPLARVQAFLYRQVSGARFGNVGAMQLLRPARAPAGPASPPAAPITAPFPATTDNDLTPEQVRANLAWHLQHNLASLQNGPRAERGRRRFIDYVCGSMRLQSSAPVCSAAGLPARLPLDMVVAADESKPLGERIQHARAHYQSILAAVVPSFAQ